VQAWEVKIGDSATREELVARYGGSVYSGGIVPALATKNVFLFTDPEEGGRYGYDFDGPSEDGIAFYYTGQGTEGDHELTAGNRALHEHGARGHSLRLFTADGLVHRTRTKVQRYVGEFRIDSSSPYRREISSDRNGATRSVLVFRLLPVGGVLQAELQSKRPAAPSPQLVPNAQLVGREVDTTYFYETTGSEPSSSDKAESRLVAEFEKWRGSARPPFKRWAIRIDEATSPLLTDIYDEHTSTLFEAKGSESRDAVRQAIGQLLDYRRHIPVAHFQSALLLPAAPSQDLQALISDVGLGLIHRDIEGSFKASELHRRHLRDQIAHRRESSQRQEQ
jgi:hypothetical protein